METKRNGTHVGRRVLNARLHTWLIVRKVIGGKKAPPQTATAQDALGIEKLKEQSPAYRYFMLCGLSL